MINYERRKRQASENSSIIITRFAEDVDKGENLYPGTYYIRNEEELLQLVEKVRREVIDKAKCIQKDWSIPIILEAIGRMYYGDHQNNKQYGPFLKRALVYLWNDNEVVFPNKKNLESLVEVFKLCYVLELLYGFRKFFLISSDFSFKVENGYFYYDDEYKPMIAEFATLIQGRGRRMRIAAVNSKLMNGYSKDFYNALLKVLRGTEPKSIAIFKGTFYEKIPGISNLECKKFWQSVFFRYMFYGTTLFKEFAETDNKKEFTPSVTLFPEFGVELPEAFFTQDIVQDTFWNKEWLCEQEDERYSSLIVERPVLRITPDGDFATCSVLIGDSINYFIESQILDYTFRSPKIKLPSEVFKNTISAPFEDKVIEKLRELGFYAGHVTEDGIWKTQERAIDLNWDNDIKLYGEIDALAYNPSLNFAILVECKVLNDVRDYKSYRNIVSKLVDDSEGFRVKILKKGKWVDQALSNYYKADVSAVDVILTDIPIPVIDFSDRDIIVTYYEQFAFATEQLLEKYGE